MTRRKVAWKDVLGRVRQTIRAALSSSDNLVGTKILELKLVFVSHIFSHDSGPNSKGDVGFVSFVPTSVAFFNGSFFKGSDLRKDDC